METQNLLSPEAQKIIQRLFIFVDSGDIQLNRELNLIVNPQILKILFKHLQSQSNEIKFYALKYISQLYLSNSFNSLILSKRDKQIQQFNYSLLEEILTFTFSLKLERQQAQKLPQILMPFILHYPITCKIIKHILNVVAKDFCLQKLNCVTLRLALKILDMMVRCQCPQQLYWSYFFMYGQHSGIKMIQNQSRWPFSKGVYFYCKFYLDKASGLQPMHILILQTPKEEFSITIDQDNKLLIKVFSKQEPIIIATLEKQQWITLQMKYQEKSRLFGNTYSLTVKINKWEIEKNDLPIPSVSMKDEFQVGICRDFYGRMNCVILSRSDIQWPETPLNTFPQIESYLILQKKNLRNLHLLYHPSITTYFNNSELIYQLTSLNHGELCQNTGIFVNPFKEVDINYYGGLYTYLPFLHILKFYKFQKYREGLADVLMVILGFFKCGFVNVEEEGVNCRFFEIASQLINEVQTDYITQEVAIIISKISSHIKLPVLRRQFFLNFLWRINIRRLTNLNVIYSFHTLIYQQYINNFQQSYSMMPFYQIILYLIDSCQPTSNKNKCCNVHWYMRNRDSQYQELMDIDNSYKVKCNVVREIVRKSIMPKFHYMDLNNSKIMNFLLYDYSPCLKIMILEFLVVGLPTNPTYYLHQLNLIPYIFQFLEIYKVSTELARIIDLLTIVLDRMKSMEHQFEKWEFTITSKIGEVLDQIYRGRSGDFRFRGKSQRIHIKQERVKRRNSQNMSQVKTDNNEKQLKDRINNLKQQKIPTLETDQELFNAIINLCSYHSSQHHQRLLKKDEFIIILQPYFKVCKHEYRLNIINMLKTTVVLVPEGSYDRLYKFMLTEFVLSELHHTNQDYILESQQLSPPPHLIKNDSLLQPADILENIFFIIDYKVMGMKKDWNSSLYFYILRLIGLMDAAKKQICNRSSKDHDQIQNATKLCLRKFIMRVIKIAQSHRQNLVNLVFLVSLVVFTNQNTAQSQDTIFTYFKSLEKYLFIDSYVVLTKKSIKYSQSPSFIDCRLILQTVNSFKFSNCVSLRDSKLRLTNFIKAYLDLKYTHEGTEYFRNRKIYLIKADFKQLSQGKQKIQSFFTNIDAKTHQDVSVGQLINNQLCLCIESSVNQQNLPLLKESLEQLQQFAKMFLLLCSRDGLKTQQHEIRNIILPKLVIYQCIHFLYCMIYSQSIDLEITLALQNTLYNIFQFIGLLITCLNQKLGQVQDFQKGLQLAQLLRHVEQYNFFSYELLDGVISLKDIIKFPHIDKQKSMEFLHHNHLKEHFLYAKTNTIMEDKIKKITALHRSNVNQTKNQIQQQFKKESFKIMKLQSIRHLFSAQIFEKQCIVQHLKKQNLFYRNTKRIWRKVWKRLRLYHYYWSIGMDQREDMNLKFQPNLFLPYKHKFSKFTDKNGVRTILQVEPVEPWHVRKMNLDKQFEYRSSNYLFHLHRQNLQQKKEKSFLSKFLSSNNQGNSNSYFYVDWIKNNSKRKGYLSIQGQKLKFKYESTYQKDSHLQFAKFILAEYKPTEKYWPLIEITSMMRRRYLTKRQCVLIEFEDNTSLIFNFLNCDLTQFLSLINEKQTEKSGKEALMKLNNVKFYTTRFNRIYISDLVEEATQQWKKHKISNFEYIIKINKYAGRNYLDPSNYPIMPWIIANYDCKQFIYRDLSKTIGNIGTQERKKAFLSKVDNIDPFDAVPPYQFGTHYSSPGVVFNFLIRLMPYTECARALQGGKFDLSDRLFNSIKICWHSITTEVSDVRQLLPQFYCLPQFLLNIQNHNFGLTQLKERVHNVIMPTWATNAYDYIALHRRELESDAVSENLHNWIDLIFGYKQKGKIAEQNLNLFYYLTYENSVDLNQIEDNQTRISMEAQVMHFGQTPSQIFTKLHPTKQKIIRRQKFPLQKLKFLFSLETTSPITLLSLQNKNLLIFKQFSLLNYRLSPIKLVSKLDLLRYSSKQNLYHLEDINFDKRIVLFGGNRFIAISAYVNGDLVIYSVQTGRKVEEKKGAIKNCIYVNQREDLLICGCRNGLLEVFQIIYGQKDTLSLMKISAEYYMSPIINICQGGNFFAINTGNLIVIAKITRGLSYIYNKSKMKGIKMIRSLDSPRSILGCLLCDNPLFCIIFYNVLELISYSINGQLLKVRQVEALLPPQRITDDFMNDYVIVIQEKQLAIYSTPFLEAFKMVSLPNKIFKEMKLFQGGVYLVTNFGQVMCFCFELKEEE